jgi:dienelactone hydrolase
VVEIEGFALSEFTFDGKMYPVYRGGTGPAVLVIHEVPGVIPEVVRFARWVVDAGFTVYMPSLFGTPLKPFSYPYAIGGILRACVNREFATFAQHRSSPIVAWLRDLARSAFDECGGKGVGAVGMCLTGNFALAMMVEPFMMAPVLAQPSLPGGISKSAKRALGISDAELAGAKERIAAGARILGFRFNGDPLCPPDRFACLRETFGTAFEGHELDPKDANPKGIKPPHSVLTTNLIDEPGQPTKLAAERCLSFLREQLV